MQRVSMSRPSPRSWTCEKRGFTGFISGRKQGKDKRLSLLKSISDKTFEMIKIRGKAHLPPPQARSVSLRKHTSRMKLDTRCSSKRSSSISSVSGEHDAQAREGHEDSPGLVSGPGQTRQDITRPRSSTSTIAALDKDKTAGK